MNNTLNHHDVVAAISLFSRAQKKALTEGVLPGLKSFVISCPFDLNELGVPAAIARELGYELNTIRCDMLSASDFTRLHFETGEKVASNWIRQENVVFYFSNVNGANAEVQDLVGQLLVDREIYGTAMHDSALCIAHYQEDLLNPDRVEIPATIRKQAICHKMNVNVYDWLRTYAVEKKLAPTVMAMLHANTYLFMTVDSDRGIPPTTPATWEGLSDIEKTIMRQTEDYRDKSKRELLAIMAEGVMGRHAPVYVNVLETMSLIQGSSTPEGIERILKDSVSSAYALIMSIDSDERYEEIKAVIDQMEGETHHLREILEISRFSGEMLMFKLTD